MQIDENSNFGNSDLHICNRALKLLKQAGISSFYEDSKEANLCKFLYPMVKAEVLVSYPWKNSIKYINLMHLIDHKAPQQPENNKAYSYKFLLPLDCLRILEVTAINNNSFIHTSNYIKNGNYLFNNAGKVKLKYISDMSIQEVSLGLSYLITLKLAAEMGYNLLDNLTLIIHLKKLYEEEYKKLASLDSKEGENTLELILEEPSWIISRYS
ncbi:hypothetical protein ABSA28_00966 [Candidatus Hepatincolaceae symbiont of Richtersius coronifer]